MNPNPQLKSLRLLFLYLIEFLWLSFTIWLFLYGMPISAFFGVLVVLAARLTKRKWGWTMGAMGLGLIMVPLIGLPEYGETTNRLHCRTLGFMAKPPASDCKASDVLEGQSIYKNGGPLFSLKERMGVHGFNFIMSIGGRICGLPEVADETIHLSFAADPLKKQYGSAVDSPSNIRRKQCQASNPGAQAHLAKELRVEDDFFLQSSEVRKAIHLALKKLPKTPGAQKKTDPVHWLKNSSYEHAVLNDSVRVALALEVGDSIITLKRKDLETIDITWSGIIHYPGTDLSFSFRIPSLWGPITIRLSETIFCGMHIDGAMNPYPLIIHTSLKESDPRISTALRTKSQSYGIWWLAAQLGKKADNIFY